jgi:polysaccharide deacetylase family protein (PEP-CTERM system associated)
MLNAISVDVEDYFQTEAMSAAVAREDWDAMPSRVERNTHRILEIFDELRVHGTFFFLGWVADRYPALVAETQRRGHEIGCHSYWHRAIFRLSPEDFREDTHRAKSVIEDAAGVACTGYRAPSFSITPATPWAFDILAELDFAFDSSVNPVRHDFYANPNAPRHPHRVASGSLLELPIATWRLGNMNVPVGGGAYLRILPYRFIHAGISAMNGNEKKPAMFYLHPWEIDPDQPRLQVSLKSRLRQYTRLSLMEHNLRRLIRDFHCGTISEAFAADMQSQSANATSASSH